MCIRTPTCKHRYICTWEDRLFTFYTSMLYFCWFCLVLYSALHTLVFYARVTERQKTPTQDTTRSWKIQSPAKKYMWFIFRVSQEGYCQVKGLVYLENVSTSEELGQGLSLTSKAASTFLWLRAHLTVFWEFCAICYQWKFKSLSMLTYLLTSKTHQVLGWSSM